MTEKQKETLQLVAGILDLNEYSILEDLKADFPEAFAEPKPERESIDVRIEFNRKAEGMLLSKSGLIYTIRKRVNDFCMLDREATVTELPAPEDNGWSDELVEKFLNYYSDVFHEGMTFNGVLANFKLKHKIK